jgi:hypothetical protein
MVPTFALLRELRKEHLRFLKKETRCLGVLLLIFQLSYFVRAVFLFGYGNWYKAQQNLHPNQSSSQAYYNRQMIYYSSFLIWDLPPVLFQLVLHVRNFKADNRQSVRSMRTDNSPSIQEPHSTVKDGEVEIN